jgi:hypothetical protein
MLALLALRPLSMALCRQRRSESAPATAMRRRDVITLLGGAAASSVSWPLAVRAQQPATPLIGYLSTASPGTYAPPDFRQGLSQAGYIAAKTLGLTILPSLMLRADEIIK